MGHETLKTLPALLLLSLLVAPGPAVAADSGKPAGASYKLHVLFTKDDAKAFSAPDTHQRVALVKQVHGQNPGKPVIWVTFDTFEQNTIEWTEVYGLYGSTTKVEHGALIEDASPQNPALPNVFYPFENNVFDNPGAKIPGKNNYGIDNHDGRELTFGMSQAVTVRGEEQGANPLNAVSVFNNQTAKFTPIEKVQVFLQTQYDNGVIISDIEGAALTVDLTEQSEKTVHYDMASGTFVEGPLPK